MREIDCNDFLACNHLELTPSSELHKHHPDLYVDKDDVFVLTMQRMVLPFPSFSSADDAVDWLLMHPVLLTFAIIDAQKFLVSEDCLKSQNL